MSAATITVLIPVRGSAEFLPAALASLRAQEDVAWRALLVADGAAAQAAAQREAAADARIEIAHTTAATALEALAVTAAAVTTEFLCVLDGDDLLAPAAFTALRAALEAQPDAGMAYSRHVLVDAGGRVLGPGPLCELPYSADALLLDFMTGPLRLLRSAAFRRAGGYANTDADAADYDLCLRLSETCGIVHVPQVLYSRRIHPAAAEVARWAEAIKARYSAFVAAVQRRGLEAQYHCALEIDSWHVLQPLRPFGGVGNWR